MNYLVSFIRFALGFLVAVNRQLGYVGAISLFETRDMIRALEQMKPVQTFLLDTFFTETETHVTKHVDIDIIKGKRRVAPFVSPLVEGTAIDRIGYTTNTYEPPYVKPKMVTHAQDFLKRQPGETIYGSSDSAGQRAAMQVGKDLAQMDELITRREEWMAATALQTGKIVVSGEGISATIDFLMDASHIITLTGTDLWSDTTNSDPLGDLRTWKRLIFKDSGLNPTHVIMGTSAIDAFMAHPKVTNALDIRRITLGQIDPAILANGVTYYGTLNEVGIDVYSYDEYFDTGSGDTALVDAKKVIMGSNRARCTRHYGAIQDLEVNAAMSRFPKSWEEKDPSVRFIMVQSAPLMALHQVDAFVCAKVLS